MFIGICQTTLTDKRSNGDSTPDREQDDDDERPPIEFISGTHRCYMIKTTYGLK